MDNRQNVVELNDNNVYQKLLEVIKKLYVIKKFDTFNNDEKGAINKIFRDFDEAEDIEFSKKDIIKKLFTVLYRYYKAGYNKIDYNNCNEDQIFLTGNGQRLYGIKMYAELKDEESRLEDEMENAGVMNNAIEHRRKKMQMFKRGEFVCEDLNNENDSALSSMLEGPNKETQLLLSCGINNDSLGGVYFYKNKKLLHAIVNDEADLQANQIDNQNNLSQILEANSLKPAVEWKEEMEDKLNKENNENKCLCSLDCLKYNGKLFGLC